MALLPTGGPPRPAAPPHPLDALLALPHQPPPAAPPTPPGVGLGAGAPMASSPMGAGGGTPGGFPTTDPASVMPLLSQLAAAQEADRAALEQQQTMAAAKAQEMLSQLQTLPNPDAQHAVSEPGYRTPPTKPIT